MLRDEGIIRMRYEGGELRYEGGGLRDEGGEMWCADERCGRRGEG